MSVTSRFATLFTLHLLALIAALLAGCKPADNPEKYGRVIAMRVDVPRSAVDKMLNYKGTFPQRWFGDFVELPDSGNPYTIVLTLDGIARVDGPMGGVWSVGWDHEERGHLEAPVFGDRPRTFQAGDPIRLEGAGMTLQFKTGNRVRPMIHVEHVTNVDVQGVGITVWSGPPKRTWRDWLRFVGPFVGVPLVLAVLWYFYRRH